MSLIENKNATFWKAIIGVIFMFCITILLLACIIFERTPNVNAEAYTQEHVTLNKSKVLVFTYDSCEYIKTKYGVTHKGNCIYCASRSAQNR